MSLVYALRAQIYEFSTEEQPGVLVKLPSPPAPCVPQINPLVKPLISMMAIFLVEKALEFFQATPDPLPLSQSTVSK